MRVFIATPTAGGVAPVAYARTLVSATMAIHAAGGTYQYLTIDGAIVSLARNMLAQAFLADKACTHILFIDSDMAIETSVFKSLLRAKHPIIGAIYSERRIDLATYAQTIAKGGTEAAARAAASKFNIRIDPGEITVSQNMCKVKAFGFGCVLIERSVFEALIAGQVVKPLVSSRVQNIGDEPCWDFFSEIPLENGDFLSEDYAFCQRVADLGDIPLMGYIGGGVGHVGQFAYSAPYVERLKTGKF